MKKIFTLLLLLNAAVIFAQPIEDSVSLSTTSGILKGSRFLPAGKTSFPVLIIIPGSGPTDRYGNNPMGVKANSYKMMATELSSKNIGVLLFDKRGIAGSRTAAGSEADLRFETYVNDVVEWIQWLQKDKRVKGIFVAGHSEGSLIGILAAQKIKTQGFISIAGPAKGIAEIITGQYAAQLPKAAVIVDSLFKRLQNNQPLDTVPPYLMSIFRPSVQPYMKSWMKYIPCNELNKLTIPILIIQGTTDLQVNAIEAIQLKKCSKNALLVFLDSMNHVLKDASANRVQNMATYANPTLPLSAGLMPAIFAFIQKNNH